MISSDKEFFTVYFDGINKRLTGIETRLTALESTVTELKAEQRVIINRIDIQDRLIWGGLGWLTFLITFTMFIQGLIQFRKTDSKTESKSIITLEAVKELMNVFKPENKHE